MVCHHYEYVYLTLITFVLRKFLRIKTKPCGDVFRHTLVSVFLDFNLNFHFLDKLQNLPEVKSLIAIQMKYMNRIQFCDQTLSKSGADGRALACAFLSHVMRYYGSTRDSDLDAYESGQAEHNIWSEASYLA